jgi:hypothetical protein
MHFHKERSPYWPNTATPGVAQASVSQLTHKVSSADHLCSQKGVCDKGVCTNQGSPLMQMKGCIGTNHGAAPITSYDSPLCK